MLSLPPGQRTKSQIKTLVEFSIHLKFFAELSAEMSEEAHYQCCQCLTYSNSSPGKVPCTQFLFHQGDEGTKFFIILSGSCSVLGIRERSDSKVDFRQLAVLRQGECFGELALISNKPRAASVLCREECHFAVLERSDYKRILAKIQDSKLQEKVDLLMRHAVFGRWTKGSVQRLSYFFKIRHVKRKQVIFRAGEEVKEVFFIKGGYFQLVKDVVIQIQGSEAVKSTRCNLDITVVSTGEILGAEEAIESTPFTYTCLCSSTQGEIMTITRDDFQHVMASDETVDYLISMNKTKESYRQQRVTTAILVEKQKRRVNSVYEQGGNGEIYGKLRDDLMSEKFSTINKRKYPTGSNPESPVFTEKEERVARSGSASGMLAGEFEGKRRERKGRSWSDIFIQKYTNKPRSSFLCDYSPSPPPHTKSLKELIPRLKKLSFVLPGTDSTIPKSHHSSPKPPTAVQGRRYSP